MSDDAASAKAKGVDAFKAKDFETAIVEFSKAIELNPTDHTLYGNLSASYFNVNKFEEAVESANKCISVNPSWSKGYQRKGMALAALDKNEEAKEAYEKGLELEPTNAQIKESLSALESKMSASDNPFFNAEALTKLMMNEKTRRYMDDPDFKMKFEFCKSNPQMFMQLMQVDKRFMEVFQVITGLDLEVMQKSQEENHARMEELKKQQEEKKRKEEEERLAKEAEEAVPDDERVKRYAAVPKFSYNPSFCINDVGFV